MKKIDERGADNMNYYESVIGKDKPKSFKESVDKFSGYVLGKKELPRLNEAEGPSARDLIEVMYDSEFEYGKGYGKKSDDEYLYSLPDWLLDQIQNRWYKIQKDKRNAAKPKVVSQDMEESTLKEAAEPAVDIVARAVAILVDDYGYDENEAFNVVHDMSDPYELDDQYRNRGANEEVIEELADSIVHLVIKA